MEPRTITVPAEALPVADEADVVVIGGGTSGFIAAAAAARSGARTILLERFGYLGGCTTTTYNTSIGHFFDSEDQQIIGGLGWEFVERMKAEGEGFVVGRSPQLWPPTTKKIALDMVEEAGVNLYFYTWVSSVIREDGVVQGVVVQNKGGRSVILGKTFIDASGDADVAAFAGAPFDMTDVENLQQVSINYTACGVDAARVIEWAAANREKLVGISGTAFEHKPYGPQPMFTFIIPNPQMDENGNYYHVGVMPTVKLCVYREAVRLQGNVEINPLDPKALTYAEVRGLRGALDHLKYLKETVPGFEGAFVVAQNHLGVRESRRIVGEYMLTEDDLRSQARFPDVVGLNCRALDFHLKGTVFKIEFLEGHHDIPLRVLIPQRVDNLLVCGRSISCDHAAQASLRGAATCMATGHAAGTAAALVARCGGFARRVDVPHLQKLLRSQGAILSTEVDVA